MERKKEQARREREIQARQFQEEKRKNDIVTHMGLFSEPRKKVPHVYQATSYLFKVVFQVEAKIQTDKGDILELVM